MSRDRVLRQRAGRRRPHSGASHRRDGVTLGLHQPRPRPVFGGVLHRAAPGMLPSAVRRTAGLTGDSAEMRRRAGARFDCRGRSGRGPLRRRAGRGRRGRLGNAANTRCSTTATVGAVAQEDGGFTAELRSAKAALEADPVPRTSPTCRARSAARAAGCRRRGTLTARSWSSARSRGQPRAASTARRPNC